MVGYFDELIYIQNIFHRYKLKGRLHKMEAKLDIEKSLQKNHAFRRNKHYLDIEGILSKEQNDEVERRKPSASIQTLDTRVDNSFINSIKPMRQKVKKQIESVWKAYKEESRLKSIEYQREKENVVQGPNMSKMISRNQVYKYKSAYHHQYQFDNFCLTHPQNKNIKFSQMQARKPLNKEKIQTTIEEKIDTNEIGRISERIKFNQAINRCLVEFNKNRKSSAFNKTVEPDQRIIMSTDRIKNSELLTRKNESCTLFPFYLSTSKNVACQMDMRLKKSNQFFYLKKKEEEKMIDISSKQKKEKMIEKRAEQLMKKKKLPDNRQQMCDLRYFRRNFLDSEN